MTDNIKKLGRPTNSPKTKTIKIRMDDETVDMLDELVTLMNKGNRSEVVRTIIREDYNAWKEK